MIGTRVGVGRLVRLRGGRHRGRNVRNASGTVCIAIDGSIRVMVTESPNISFEMAVTEILARCREVRT